MKKFGLLLIPLMAMPFLVNCNHNTYHFKFIGNHCKINGRANFDINITKNESNVQYTITPDDGYQLDYLDNEYQEDFTLESNVLTILEMKQDYTITVNAIDENIAVTFDVGIDLITSNKVQFSCEDEDTITEVDWGDGIKNTENKHSYTEEGLYSIAIKGDLTSFGARKSDGVNNVIRANIYSKNITLGSLAFHNCDNLVSVNLPNEMTSLGYGAFTNCASLESIKLPKNLTCISKYDFNGCTSLTSIVIPNGVTIIEYGSFSYCSKLTSIKLPDGLIKLDTNCFLSCTSLVSINLPSSLIYIEASCFEKCSALTSIVIPDNVVSIGSNAFHNCTNLASINIPTNSEFTYIPDDFCNGTAITSIKIPNNVTEIISGAFARCSNLVLADLSEVDHVIEGGNAFGDPSELNPEFKIKVQANLVDEYKTSTYWSDYVNFIEAA